MRKLSFLPLMILTVGCSQPPKESTFREEKVHSPDVYKSFGAIPEPQGFTRVTADPGSFPAWLRMVALKKDKTVYLYNGRPKPNQSAQFAVLDISIGNKDLQQCADAVMRLRAEYLYAQKKYSAIAFMDYNGKWYRWLGAANRPAFDRYLDNVFGYCGSASLEKQLKPVMDFNTIGAGDVFVKGGFPGHAMLVVDVAMNDKGEKVYMLAQGYQPAQDIHIVVNPADPGLSPWYGVTDTKEITTPEWLFHKNQLKSW